MLARSRPWFGMFGLTACIVGWGVIFIVAGIGHAQSAEDVAVPPDVVLLDELVKRYQAVPFEHRLHAEMAEMGGGCQTCHHRTPNGHTLEDLSSDPGQTHTQDESAEIPACKSCHPIAEDKHDIRMPTLNAAYHRQCLDCHRDWDDQDSCVVCHEPREGAEQSDDLLTPDVILGRMHPPADPPKTKVYKARFTPAAGAYVTFRHDEHIEVFGFKCVECHRNDSCESCHSSNGLGKVRNPLKPAESWRLSHEPCMTCHDHQTCDHCHHQTEEDPPTSFEHRMTGQLLDPEHQDLSCRSCHGAVNFTAIPTCGDVDCHKSPDLAAYPDRRPGELVEPIMPRVRRQSLTEVYGVEPRVRQTDLTDATDTIIPQPDGMPQVRPRPKMTTVERPTTKSESCVTSECHVAIKSYDVVHGPVAIDACSVCHELVDEEAHLFTIIRDRQELCTYCHAFDVNAMPVVHTPTKEGECLGCHNPHGGHDQSMTREVSIERLCNRCHESVTAMQAYRHSPVNAGYCVSCHSPHASQYPKLLDAVGPDLCLSCHDEFGQQLDSVRFVHEAMDEQCTRCHDVHGSAFPMSLVAPGESLCFECHGDTAEHIATAEYPHTVATENTACMNCHTPHGSDLASLMRDLPARLCMNCHNEAVETPDGRVVASVNDVMSEDLYKHGQINEGECSGCHEPHGGSRAVLLTGPYEENYYGDNVEQSYGLCLECHEKALAEQAEVSIGEGSPTRFRNGSLNLHYLHVAKGRGRNCRVCHGIHTGDNEHLLLSIVPYQKWEAPLELIETETGGRCVTGCHLPFSYDRVTSVALDHQREAGEEVRRIRSVGTEPVKIQWQGVDLSGQTLEIPVEEEPTLLLFVGTDHEQDLRMLKAIHKALSLRNGTRVIVDIDGETDAQRLEAIKQVIDPKWRMIAEDMALTTATQVKARPIALVVRPDGQVIARIGGAPQSLSLKLEAYLDMARLDKTMQLTLGSIKPNIIGREAGVGPDQYIRVAHQLIKEGHGDRAEKALHEGIELHPNESKLYAELLMLWNHSGRAEESIDLLNRLPEGTLEEVDMLRLRARACIESKRWDQAEEVVDQLLTVDQVPAEAYLIKGRIHEHFGRWQEAAEYYRRALAD